MVNVNFEAMKEEIIKILEEAVLYGYNNGEVADKLLDLHIVSKRFVLLKGKGGHVFWTTNVGDIDNDFNKILFESDNQDEIIEQWEKHNPNVW